MRKCLFILLFVPLMSMGQDSLRNDRRSDTYLSSYERLLLHGSDYSVRKWYLDEPEIGAGFTSFYFEVVEVIVGSDIRYFLHIEQGNTNVTTRNQCYISYDDLVKLCEYLDGVSLDPGGADELMGGYITSDNFKLTHVTKGRLTWWYINFNVSYGGSTRHSVKRNIVDAFKYSLEEMRKVMKKM